MIERLQALLAGARDIAGNPQFPDDRRDRPSWSWRACSGAGAGTLSRTNGHAGGVLSDAFAVVAPYLAGLVVIGLALFFAGGKPRPWYETAATLLALLAFIRIVTFLLRLSLGKSRTIKAWELRVTLIVWAPDRRRDARPARPDHRRARFDRPHHGQDAHHRSGRC